MFVFLQFIEGIILLYSILINKKKLQIKESSKCIKIIFSDAHRPKKYKFLGITLYIYKVAER